MKPSLRLLPTVGVKCFSWTLDTVGLFAAGVADVAHGLSAMTGRPELLPRLDAGAAHRRREAGFCRRSRRPRAPRRCRSPRRRRSAPAPVRALALPEIVAEAWRLHRSCRNSRRIWRSPGSIASITTRWRRCCAAGSTRADGIRPADYDEARATATARARVLAKVFDDFDVLLTFSAPGPAPEGLASTGDPRFNQLWTLMGVPCVNVPGMSPTAACRWACR